MRQFILTACIVSLAFSSTKLVAQEVTFEREFTYVASEVDSKVDCRAIATNHLRTELLNEVGVYVENEQLLKSADVGGEFSQDYIENIVTLTAGITKLEILEERWNGETFWMKAAITIDKQSLEQSLKQLIEDRQKAKDFEALKQELSATTAELDRLKKEAESKQFNDIAQEAPSDQITQNNTESNTFSNPSSVEQTLLKENTQATVQENNKAPDLKDHLKSEIINVHNNFVNAHKAVIQMHLNLFRKVKH